ncbi:MAG: cation-binding protein [Chitinivibrionales bacterium]|nr:cation-binding protein [Chitinivibrionales bacterium]MBD3395296.1 cation-binding protein [Chitinivibrionales bacterium]
MEPKGPLMKEHRLIERMIGRIEKEIGRIRRNRGVDPLFVDAAVDFIRTYADQTHHGKEEDILFAELDNKGLSAEDRTVMDELVQEHVFGRKTTAELEKAKQRYVDGDDSAANDVAERLKTLAEFYPAHIEKEDKRFFPAAMTYLSPDERTAMLDKFSRFDEGMIHRKYRNVVETLGA